MCYYGHFTDNETKTSSTRTYMKAYGRARPYSYSPPVPFPPLGQWPQFFQAPWGLEPVKAFGLGHLDGYILIKPLGRDWAPRPLASLPALFSYSQNGCAHRPFLPMFSALSYSTREWRLPHTSTKVVSPACDDSYGHKNNSVFVSRFSQMESNGLISVHYYHPPQERH